MTDQRDALVVEASLIRQHREIQALGLTGGFMLHYFQGKLRKITTGEGGPVMWEDGEQRLMFVPSVGYRKGEEHDRSG